VERTDRHTAMPANLIVLEWHRHAEESVPAIHAGACQIVAIFFVRRME